MKLNTYILVILLFGIVVFIQCKKDEAEPIVGSKSKYVTYNTGSCEIGERLEISSAILPISFLRIFT